MKKNLYGICGLVWSLALTLTVPAAAQPAPLSGDSFPSEWDNVFAPTASERIMTIGGASQPGIARPPACLPTLPEHLTAWRRIAVDDTLRDAGAVSSLNWSGYAATGAMDTVTGVSGAWTVPAVTGGAGYSALWVGIDGFDDGTVEQLGTMQEVVTVSNGRRGTTTQAQYYAWVEMYPAGMVELNPSTYPVKPGDAITASVTCSGDVFTLTMSSSEGWSYKDVATSASAGRMSAEWVAEAPSSNFGVLPLADFGTVSFTQCMATIGGVTAPIAALNWDEMTMVTQNGRTVKAQPSGLNSSGSGFTVTWEHN
ncbi:MAG: G1 family glutamic endopeptidase [Limisphaerales bacterium]